MFIKKEIMTTLMFVFDLAFWEISDLNFHLSSVVYKNVSNFFVIRSCQNITSLLLGEVKTHVLPPTYMFPLLNVSKYVSIHYCRKQDYSNDCPWLGLLGSNRFKFFIYPRLCIKLYQFSSWTIHNLFNVLV